MCVLLSERSWSEKATYCIILTIWHYGKGKARETIKTSIFPEVEGGKDD